MTDRSLLELAAKAVGVNLIFKMMPVIGGGEAEEYFNQFQDGKIGCWNPLTDDGDALRLAVKLGIDVTHFQISERVEAWIHGFKSREEDYGDDPYAATRRAIVRAAAEIGAKL